MYLTCFEHNSIFPRNTHSSPNTVGKLCNFCLSRKKTTVDALFPEVACTKHWITQLCSSIPKSPPSIYSNQLLADIYIEVKSTIYVGSFIACFLVHNLCSLIIKDYFDSISRQVTNYQNIFFFQK